jgi:hypothetical protein
VLQFHCPECGHHQPINTLRPAAQRIIGRLRAVWLVLVVFLKLNFFGWLLFACVGMGADWSHSYNYRNNTVTPSLRPVDNDAILAFTLLAIPFGVFARLLLLRWRRGWIVGLVLAGVVGMAIVVGVSIAVMDMDNQHRLSAVLGFLRTSNFPALIGWTGLMVLAGCLIAWPIWIALVRTFLPRDTGTSLLEWQRNLSNRSQGH